MLWKARASSVYQDGRHAVVERCEQGECVIIFTPDRSCSPNDVAVKSGGWVMHHSHHGYHHIMMLDRYHHNPAHDFVVFVGKQWISWEHHLLFG